MPTDQGRATFYPHVYVSAPDNLSGQTAHAKESSERSLVHLKQLLWFGSRLIPFTIFVGVIFAIWQAREWLHERDEARGYDLARITAILWVGTATYRTEPEKYSLFCDSVLVSTGYSALEIEKLMLQYARDPENSLPMLGKISRLVDSISRVREGSYRPLVPSDTLGADSASTLQEN